MTTPPAGGTGATEVAGRASGGRPVELVDVVAAAVLGVGGVAALHGGAFGEVATHLPGRQVAGIRLREDGADIHLTLIFGVSVSATAQRVREAVAGLISGPVHVTVEDVVPARVVAERQR
ncbi:MAG: hypothetical protein ABI251_05620 [Mycobacteriaceae bacterium]